MIVSDAAHAPFLHLQGITKRFDDFVALRDVNLDVAAGEFVCFLGPSGCGKTTLLRVIAGLERQSEGRIVQCGRDVSHLPAAARDFGIVFQSYALFPNLTVRANIAYGLENRGMDRRAIAGRVDELLATVGLADQSAKYPSKLSGGQQQRVALARALAPSPGLLLLDEPLSALDAKVRVHLRREVKSLQRLLGVTTIMVTHDQEEALTMADRIVVMNQGAIDQIGTPEDIYDRPQTAFVADFIGRMNFLPGRVDDADRIRIGSSMIPAVAGNLSRGSNVVVAIRPEDIQIVGGGEAGTLDVNVSAVEFLGAFRRIEVAGGDNGARFDLHVDIPFHGERSLDLVPGQPIGLRLPADRVRLFPAP